MRQDYNNMMSELSQLEKADRRHRYSAVHLPACVLVVWYSD